MTHNQRVLALLSDGYPHTHHELYALNVIGHSRVAELRKQGHDIVSWSEEGPDGERDYLYQLVPSLEEAGGGIVGADVHASRRASPPASSSESDQLDIFGVAV